MVSRIQPLHSAKSRKDNDSDMSCENFPNF